jgi:hypothetical protein
MCIRPRDSRFAAALFVTALLVTNAAAAQTYGPGTVAPPVPDDDEGQPGTPPADALPPPQAPDENAFEQGLSPYGQWVDTPEYGRVWVPSDVGPDWQPYTDGRWVDTQWGWSFASTVPWGWAAFHYGRWGFGPRLGWFWVPGFVWAPAWVSWRYFPGFVCWSPFAPDGFAFARPWPGWVVLPGVHFTHPIGRFRIPRMRAAPILHAARPVPAIASPTARATSRGPVNPPAAGTVRQRGNARAGGARAAPSSGGRGFTRTHLVGGSTFRSRFRGGSTARVVRPFAAPGASRGWARGGNRTFAGPMRPAAVSSRGFPGHRGRR